MINLSEVIHSEVKMFGETWDGFIYRTGNNVNYYHTNPLILSGSKENMTKRYHVPRITKHIVIDLDSDAVIHKMRAGLGYVAKLLGTSINEILEYELSPVIEMVAPRVRAQGFEAIVVVGQTGVETIGAPVGVICWRRLKPLQPASYIEDKDNQSGEGN